jgi:hypothetical protein
MVVIVHDLTIRFLWRLYGKYWLIRIRGWISGIELCENDNKQNLTKGITRMQTHHWKFSIKKKSKKNLSSHETGRKFIDFSFFCFQIQSLVTTYLFSDFLVENHWNSDKKHRCDRANWEVLSCRITINARWGSICSRKKKSLDSTKNKKKKKKLERLL